LVDTVGVDVYAEDAPKTPVQLSEVEPLAKALFPTANRLGDDVWMGPRPRPADRLPIIGRQRATAICGLRLATRIMDLH